MSKIEVPAVQLDVVRPELVRAALEQIKLFDPALSLQMQVTRLNEYNRRHVKKTDLVQCIACNGISDVNLDACAFCGDCDENPVKVPESKQPDAQEPTADSDDDDDGRIALTDVGNGERFRLRCGSQFRFCHAWQKWLLWEGSRWTLDSGAGCEAAAKDTARAIFHEAADHASVEIGKHATRSQSAGAIRSMLAMASSEPGIPIKPEDLDRDPFLLNVANGTIDLKTGKLEKHRRQDLITKLAPIAYDPAAKCPRWTKFISWAMGDDAELVSFVQRWFGYCLSGDVSEQKLVVAWGEGANGKSTALEVIASILGDYAAHGAPNLLLTGGSERHPTELAQLHGRRMVVCSETAERKTFDEVRLKELTGGDTVTARRMREDFWSFTPSAKLVLLTNHKPKVTGVDHAIWRRLLLLPWELRVTDEQRDPKLPQKLRAESPGILAWLVQGCVAWQRDGLGEPTKVKAATQEYRAEQNTVARFLDEACTRGPGLHSRAAHVLDKFNAWAKAGSEAALTQPELAARLKQLGFASQRKMDGVHWLGFAPRDASFFDSNSRGYR